MIYPIKVSVLVITYNHAQYIKEALDSLLMQKHDYSYEIVIADDCSTDDTFQKIQEYAAQHENFVFLPNERNHGITQNYKRAFEACRGEYIAILEGDDYWTSPHKISKMVKFLDDNRGCSMVFNRFIVAEAKTKKFNVQPWPLHEPFQLITISDLIQDNMIGNFSTCMYRNDNIRKIDPSLYEMRVYDWMFNMVNAQFGLIGYLPEVMSVYRLHPNGTWTQKTEAEKIEDMIESIDTYNKYFDFIYDEEFQAHRTRLTDRLPQVSAPLTGRQKFKQSLKGYTPPILISIAKYILPPRLLNFLKK